MSVSRLSLSVLGVGRTLRGNTPCLSLSLLLLFLLLIHHPSVSVAARTFLSVKANFPIYQRPNCVKEDDSSEPGALKCRAQARLQCLLFIILFDNFLRVKGRRKLIAR